MHNSKILIPNVGLPLNKKKIVLIINLITNNITAKHMVFVSEHYCIPPLHISAMKKSIENAFNAQIKNFLRFSRHFT